MIYLFLFFSFLFRTRSYIYIDTITVSHRRGGVLDLRYIYDTTLSDDHHVRVDISCVSVYKRSP